MMMIRNWRDGPFGEPSSRARGAGTCVLGVSAIIVVLAILNAVVGSSALLQITFWFLAVLIIIVPVDALRFNAARNPPPGGMQAPSVAA